MLINMPRHKKILLISLIVAGFLIIIGILSYFLFFRKSGSGGQISDTATQQKNSGILRVKIPVDIKRSQVEKLISSKANTDANSAVQKSVDKAVSDAIKENFAYFEREEAKRKAAAFNQDISVTQEAPVILQIILQDQSGNDILPDIDTICNPATKRGDISLSWESRFSPWDKQEVANLQSQFSQVYPVLKKVYGPPFLGQKINVNFTQDLSGLAGVYNITLNEMTVSQPDIYTLTVLAAHAFRDDAAINIQSWEEGMSQAAALAALNNTFSWDYSPGVDYERFNNPAIINSGGNFWENYSPLSEPILAWQASGAWLKVYVENNEFFTLFNQSLLKEESVNHQIVYNEQNLRNIAVKIQNTIEGVNANSWLLAQFILGSTPTNSQDFIFFQNSRTVYYFKRLANGAARPISAGQITYQAQNGSGAVLSEQILTTNEAGIAIASPITSITNKGKIKYLANTGGKEKNIQAIYYQVSGLPAGLYGIVEPAVEGKVIISSAANELLGPQNIQIQNGVFQAPTLTNFAGNFSVKIQTSAGKEVQKIINKSYGDYFAVLSADNLLPQITSINVININASSAVIEALPNKYSAMIFEIGEGSNFFQKIISPYTDNYSAKIFNLKPEQKYNYRLTLIDQFGNIGKSELQSFQTNKLLPVEKLSSSPLDNQDNIDPRTKIKIKLNTDLDSGVILKDKVKLFRQNTENFIGVETGGGDWQEILGLANFDVTNRLLIFTPSQPLATNSKYFFISEDMKGKDGFYIQPILINFSTIEIGTPSTIKSILPQSGQTNIAPEAKITISFSQPMLANSFTPEKFILQNSMEIISGQFSYDQNSRTAIFTPASPLKYNCRYYVSFGNFQDSQGNLLFPNISRYSFVTRPFGTSVPAKISSLSPADKSIDVEPNSKINVFFSGDLNQNNINNYLKIFAGDELIPGSINYDTNEKKIEFTPAVLLKPGVRYYPELFGLQDKLTNNIMPQYFDWTFVTGIYEAGVPSASKTTIIADPLSLSVGQASKITLTVKDGYGKVLSGRKIIFISSRLSDKISQPENLTDSNGQTFGQVSSDIIGSSEITAIDITWSDRNIVFSQKAIITWQ